MRDKKLTIVIIIVLMISVIGLGIAFAAFSQTLTINGTGTVESSSWSVVFEGADGSNTIGAPTLVGTATEVTHPTIKNNSTEIGDYAVTLKTPGDSVTYNFKIHNKGDYAANLTSITVSGINRPSGPIGNINLVKNKSGNPACIGDMRYSFYYTSDNMAVGQYPGRDCLEPGESEEVTLKIIFNEYNYTQETIDMYEKSGNGYLPKTDLVLDNLGISATYTQSNNGSCQWQPSGAIESAPFENYDFAYYTYEGKSFKGTGVNNIVVSDTIISREIYNDNTAKNVAEAYCTGCRLMTRTEVVSWGCSTSSSIHVAKCVATYPNSTSQSGWWLADKQNSTNAYYVSTLGSIGYMSVSSTIGVRSAVSIPAGSTMSGSGTQLDPYVITVN